MSNGGIKSWVDKKLMQSVFNDRRSKSYWNKVHELRKRGTKYIFLESSKKLNSKIISEKIAGIDILAQFGGIKRPYSKKVCGRFMAMVGAETNPKILNSLLVSIGHNNQHLTYKQTKALDSFKNHKNSSVRFGLVYAIIGKSHKCAIDTLIYLTNDKKPGIRDWATFALGNQKDKKDKKIKAALLIKLKDKDNNTRNEAIHGLALRKFHGLKKFIIEEINKGNPGTLIFESILELKDKCFIKHLRNLFKNSKNDDSINPDWLFDLKKCINDLNRMNLK